MVEKGVRIRLVGVGIGKSRSRFDKRSRLLGVYPIKSGSRLGKPDCQINIFIWVEEESVHSSDDGLPSLARSENVRPSDRMGESGITYNGDDQRWEGIEAEAISDRFDLLAPPSSRHARHEPLHPPGLQQHSTKPSKPEPTISSCLIYLLLVTVKCLHDRNRDMLDLFHRIWISCMRTDPFHPSLCDAIYENDTTFDHFCRWTCFPGRSTIPSPT